MPNHHFTSRHVIKSLKAKHQSRWSRWEKIAEWMTEHFGNANFLLLNILFFITWLIFNSEIISFVKPFDPYPFGLLTTIVSLEAIVLSIFVLISQNNSNKIDDLRQEIDLQVDIITESEITKILRMLKLLMQKNGIVLPDDPELEQMLKPINEEKIEKSLERQIDKSV